MQFIKVVIEDLLLRWKKCVIFFVSLEPNLTGYGLAPFRVCIRLTMFDSVFSVRYTSIILTSRFVSR